MGTESSSASTASPSPGGKRSRDPEDEVYLDNLHSHKRYLSEIMAYSLNGLTVGDPLPENIMESPARSESMLYLRDEMPYSPMSEDSDDSRFCEYQTSTCSSQPESLPTSPVSPYRYQRPLIAFSSAASTSSHSSYACSTTAATITSSQPRQRGSDTEGRFPSSPSDICHSGDLRRAALLRSVQMRAQPSNFSSFEAPFGSSPHMDVEEGLCFKSLNDEREYQGEDCSSVGMSDPESSRSKSRKVLNMNMKGDESGV